MQIFNHKLNTSYFIMFFNFNSVTEEEQVALPHDISSKLPLTTDKSGTQVSYWFITLIYKVGITLV